MWWAGLISCSILHLLSVCPSTSGHFPALGACQGWGPYPGSCCLSCPTAGGLWARCVPGLAARGDLLSRACRVAEPGCQTAPVLAAPPHSVICEGQGLLRHPVLLLSNHPPSAWHHLSALLCQAAPQGFILLGDGSFAPLKQVGGAG